MMISKRRESLVRRALQELNVAFHNHDQISLQQEEARNLLGDALLERFGMEKPTEKLLQITDQIWQKEKKKGIQVNDIDNAKILESINDVNIFVAKQDITTLQVDSIVNAANDQGLGCFQPSHKCIDSAIHRAAGPRLREACRNEMAKRLTPLSSGSRPIVTPGFFLPSKYVIHVTGPHVHSKLPTERDKTLLKASYLSVLDAANQIGLQSIAIPCISTGLFGYPNEAAAVVAKDSVLEWIKANPSSSLKEIIFVTFTNQDDKIYRNFYNPQSSKLNKAIDNNKLLASKWLKEAEAVLVVAGAGMSIDPDADFNVYIDEKAFAKYYPYMLAYGYRTAYECMGLPRDPNVPNSVKAGFWAQHMRNMMSFAPNQGYQKLQSLIGDKDHFVITSNVDRAFSRSGFAEKKLYEPQGTWDYYQCLQMHEVVPSKPILDRILPLVDPNTGALPQEQIPCCSQCGEMMFGNVRGGSWFRHDPYDDQSLRFEQWTQNILSQRKKFVVVEIGCGFNTPTVTRFPAEAIVREGGDKGALIRINPSDDSVPINIRAVGLDQGWEVLLEIESILSDQNSFVFDENQILSSRTNVTNNFNMLQHYFGSMNWKSLIRKLR